MTQHITTARATTAQPSTAAQPSTKDSTENQAAGRHADKVALVMGGARGIGAGIVRLLAAEGARVTFTYASATSEAEELEKTIAASGGTAVGVKANSSDRSQVREVIAELAALQGRIDIVIANAGGGTKKLVAELSDEEIDRMIDVNIRGTLDTIRFSTPHMRRGGRVIVIGSVSATHFPDDITSIYGMTKGAVASLVRGMSRELGPRGITINNVQPGPVDTPANPADGPFGDMLRETIPVGRFGKVTEIASLVSHIASEDGGYINGASLDIDGGYSA
ncbi:SDR family NAD(P)-dependent oxidoreductase [Nesterenkonia sp. Act20]|uniref:SDR family NAD(P)-dependent oxidoreductase n=1 Tax=Nesterenkonia sp. Act20 TaxID=1483432 RepID=UPI001C4694B6|nr:SDR family oxidoreductase [Nesterenkonia sp. Act20]